MTQSNLNAFKVKIYNQSDCLVWNAFVSNSKNATFLFNRDFMEYHQDRFDDYSLMIYKNDKLVSLLPANKNGAIVYSHQGLTYGDLVFINDLDTKQRQVVYEAMLLFFQTQNIKKVVIKSLPKFYDCQKSISFNPWLTQDNSLVSKQNMVLAIDYNADYKIHKTKLKRYNKFQRNGFIIKQGRQELDVFWSAILVNRLEEKHNSKPVHSILEIQDLHFKFEQEINQYNIYQNEEVLAGITIFKKGLVVKSQYAMATIAGERLGALDMLFVYLIEMFKSDGMRYFSMGSVTDDSKLGYSQGMLKQKQELGCTTYIQDIIKLDING